METIDVDNKYFVHTNMFEDQYQLAGVSWELEEELEEQNIRIEWETNDQGNKMFVVNKSSKLDVSTDKIICDDIKIDNVTIKKYICDICNKGYTSKTYFNQHKEVHTGVKVYKCTVCLKEYIGVEKLICDQNGGIK